MTVDVEDDADFDEILAEIKAHDDAIKENYAAQKELWEKLVNTFGAEEAANIVCAVNRNRMARMSKRLSSLKVAQARQPGMLADGDGLYLQISNATSFLPYSRYN
jgi:hypothetical protein